MSLLKRIENNQEQPKNENRGSKLQELRVKRASPATGSRDAFVDLKNRIQQKLIAELDPSIDITQSSEVRSTIQEMFETMLVEEQIVLSRNEKRVLFEQIVAEILGFGPLEKFLNVDGVTEIMVNGPKQVYIERDGKLQRVSTTFEDDEHLLRIIDRIVAPLGRRIDEGAPMVDARLPDGSRVNAVIPPISINGPTLTIRLFSKIPLTIENLIEFGSITPEAVEFLKACILARLNLVVSGGTGSGKTTLLNILSNFIPDTDRIVTIENAAELQLRQEHVVTLESRPPNVEGRGAVSIRDLVVNSLRMRPDRIVVGEVRSGEALDMLQAMNTGHDGSLTTLHANSPRDALSRLETMVLMAGMELPHRAIREQIASALDLVVHTERMRDGTRKVVSISEIQGMEGEVITMSEIFRFEQTSIEDGKVIGRLRPTGLRPKFMYKIREAGIMLPPSIFGIGVRNR
ncbi:MAG TPA: CpaF family protein [Candidatus Sulfomarinibacteraceae bacterium]|nr:CpaF family protein [Candidatus Sulfomarinibacteraceae bacterium]